MVKILIAVLGVVLVSPKVYAEPKLEEETYFSVDGKYEIIMRNYTDMEDLNEEWWQFSSLEIKNRDDKSAYHKIDKFRRSYMPEVFHTPKGIFIYFAKMGGKTNNWGVYRYIL